MFFNQKSTYLQIQNKMIVHQSSHKKSLPTGTTCQQTFFTHHTVLFFHRRSDFDYSARDIASS